MYGFMYARMDGWVDGWIRMYACMYVSMYDVYIYHTVCFYFTPVRQAVFCSFFVVREKNEMRGKAFFFFPSSFTAVLLYIVYSHVFFSLFFFFLPLFFFFSFFLFLGQKKTKSGARRRVTQASFPWRRGWPARPTAPTTCSKSCRWAPWRAS